MMYRMHIKAIALFALIVATITIYAQSEKQIRIKIDADVNGERIQIDTTMDYISDFELEKLLNDFGLADEIGELNIRIDDTPDMRAFEFKAPEEEFNMMMQELERIQIPAIPEAPPMPGTANMMFFKGNKVFLGVVTEKTKGGVVIKEVVANSTAKEAGLKEGDIITKINEMTVESTHNLAEILSEFEPGEAITITYSTDGKIYTTKAVLKANDNYFESKEWEEYGKQWEDWGKEFEMRWKDLDREGSEEAAFLGVYLGEAADKGVLIEGTEQGSGAEKAGLMKGDIIAAINGKKVSQYAEIVEVISGKNPGDIVTITYIRNGKEFQTEATLGRKKTGIYMWKGNEEGKHTMPFPQEFPGRVHTYAYCFGDGEQKDVNMQIRVIRKSENNAVKSIDTEGNTL
ncbi:MAG: PDZ domain-containing protein, partial [Chitinophagales bacterium]